MNQRQHDMGGMDADPIKNAAHEAEPWAKMVTSLAAAMRCATSRRHAVAADVA